jgi:hypothetical protein
MRDCAFASRAYSGFFDVSFRRCSLFGTCHIHFPPRSWWTRLRGAINPVIRVFHCAALLKQRGTTEKDFVGALLDPIALG